MSILIKKIIFHQDFIDHYHNHEFVIDKDMPHPYLAGELTALVPSEAKLDSEKTKGYSFSLFNKSGLMSQTISVGKYGFYYLELRTGHLLSQLIVEPDEVVSDIYFGEKNTLIYSFYNPLDRETIVIKASIEKDIENTYQKLKSDPTNLEWRQYFVRRNLIKFDKSHKPEKVYPELMTADQVADYLQCQKKTIQNWTSLNKIPYKGKKGSRRYKKSDIELWNDARQKKETKRRR